MITSRSKVSEDHLRRKACIYIRQSSLAQVQEHQESTRRQYDLQGCAQSLGWETSQIEVIDEDLGQSASAVGRVRAGYQRLLAWVVTGEVGAIFSLEVSRLARQDSEGYRLVEVAALTGTLLIDEQQVYDPSQGDDRLMLGLKVLLSSNEVRIMRQRLQENKMRKAQRGELRLSLPIGLVYDRLSGVVLDADEQVQGAVRLVFSRFRLSGRLNSVVQYFRENGLLFPRRKGNWDGALEWGVLSTPRTHSILSNPLYAGAYVYGRTRRQTVVRSGEHIERRPRPLLEEEWGAVRWEAFSGYISRQEYEQNQARLAQNLERGNISQRGRRQDGAALLSGSVVCGHCGKRMYVSYNGDRGQYLTYICNTDQMRYAQPACQRIPGKEVDRLVEECVLAALTPAQIELSLAVVAELERQQIELAQQRQRRVEGARYTAHLAERRFQQVDPDNRLVARTLEAQWEASLQEVTRLEAEAAKAKGRQTLTLNPEQRQQLLKLAEDLPRVWASANSTERKDLLQLLIADVTLTRSKDEIGVQIRWHTNQVDAYTLPLPILGSPKTPEVILQRIRALYQSKTDQQIAEILNREGLLTSYGNPFTARTVGDTRRRNDIAKPLKVVESVHHG